MFWICNAMSSSLVTLPRELLARIFRHLDRRTLIHLARTCRALRIPAESVAFEEVSLQIHGSRRRYVHNGRTTSHFELCLPMSKALSMHTRSLDISSPLSYASEPNNNELEQSSNLLNILRACAPNRLRALCISFALDANPSLHKSEFLETANSKRFALEDLSLRNCSWSFADPLVLHSGASLRQLQWTAPLKDARTTRRNSGDSIFRLQVNHLPNLKSLLLRLGSAETDMTKSLLEQLAPQLEYLLLGTGMCASRDDPAWSAARLPAWSFPNLLTFYGDNLPFDLYSSIISTCTQLKEVAHLDIPDIQTSLLETLPDSLQCLQSNLSQHQDPLETLVERLGRFKSLKKLPRIIYYDPKGQDSVLHSTKKLLLAHFDALGIYSSERERKDFLHLYRREISRRWYVGFAKFELQT